MFPVFCCNYRTRRLHESKFHTNLRGNNTQLFFISLNFPPVKDITYYDHGGLISTDNFIFP